MTPSKHKSKHGLTGFRKSQAPAASSKVIYKSAQIGDEANAVLGNVYHNHFHGTSNYLATIQPGNNGANRSLTRTSDFSQISSDAISDYDHRYEHWLRAQRRTPGTCCWFTALTEYHNWAAKMGPPILVCLGSVGCGKSVATSAVIDWLTEPRGETGLPGIVLSYYVDAGRPTSTTTLEILRALIKQIVLYYQETNTEPPAEISSLIKTVCEFITTTSNNDSFISIIQYFLNVVPSCFLVIDGVDALSENEVLILIDFLRRLWPSFHADSPGRLMLSCRETLGRRIRPEKIPSSAFFSIKLEHLKHDLQLYVEWEVNRKQQERPITEDTNLVDEIKEALNENCGKMFLWIHLQILSIWDPGLTTCDQDIRDQLKALPEGLDEVYLRCLRRIDATNEKRSQEIAPRVFRWVACARQPLTPAQAREAVSMTPENLPLQEAQLLTCPVTDYCANLVVSDDLTGTVRFPHPSVKDFLGDREKVPAELSYLALSETEDNHWCGRICVAYAKLHHSRKAIVPFCAQEIPTNITTPILKNVLGSVFPIRSRKPSSTSNAVTFRMPVTAVSNQAARKVPDSRLHQYMCRNWLHHNASIEYDSPHFADFANLCLNHDPDLQPWATTSATNMEHYQRMVLHAVLENHAALLRIAHDHVKSSRTDYWDAIFLSYVPGTGSTYLHFASALGHVEVVEVLLRVYPKTTADMSGLSAAAVAVQARQNEVLKVLMDHKTPSLSRWQKDLRLPSDWKQVTGETLLDLCAIDGDVEAAAIVLDTNSAIASQQPNKFHDLITRGLASAFFLACRHGNVEVARFLANHGANPIVFEPALLGSLYPYSSKEPQSALQAALEHRDVKMMRTLLEVEPLGCISNSGCDLVQVLVHFDGLFPDSEPFVALLLEYGNKLPSMRQYLVGDDEISWIRPLIESESIEFLPFLTFIYFDRFVRMVLQAWYSGPGTSVSRTKFANWFGTMQEEKLKIWLHKAADDVLVYIVELGMISVNFLQSIVCLQVAVSRPTSRFLEAISVSCLHEDPQEHLGTECACLLEPEPAVDSLMRTLNPQYQSRNQAEPPEGILNVTAEGCQQIHEFFLCCSAHDSDIRRRFHADVWRHYFCLKNMIVAYELHEPERQFPRLMWMRCYHKTKGNVSVTRQLCHELQQGGGTGNFALNAPRGYVFTEDMVRFHGSYSVRGWIIMPEIRRALLRWNFRLNRALKKPFSESDAWYAADILDSCYRNFCRQHRESLMTRAKILPFPELVTPTSKAGMLDRFKRRRPVSEDHSTGRRNVLSE